MEIAVIFKDIRSLLTIEYCEVLEEIREEEMKREDKFNKVRKLTGEITNFLNTFSDKSQDFNKAMSMEHRTLQQSFTRVCLQWLEHVAGPDYNTDPRNQTSKEIAQEMIAAFKKEKGNDFNPSQYLGHI